VVLIEGEAYEEESSERVYDVASTVPDSVHLEEEDDCVFVHASERLVFRSVKRGVPVATFSPTTSVPGALISSVDCRKSRMTHIYLL
jgi:hypothetical protein